MLKIKIIKVKQQDNKFLVLEDINYAKAALLADVSFIQIKTI